MKCISPSYTLPNMKKFNSRVNLFACTVLVLAHSNIKNSGKYLERLSNDHIKKFWSLIIGIPT